MAIKNIDKKINIWEGVYKSYKHAPTTGLGFKGKIWKNKSFTNITHFLKLAEKKKIIPEFVFYRESLLPFLATLTHKDKKIIKIIDFGGNLGQEFISIQHSTNIKSKDIQYYIIENKDICEMGNKLFKYNKRIKFLSDLPKTVSGIDIIHVGSALQYVENWRKMLKEFVRLKPSYILFTDLQAGDIPTYVTVQNYYDSKIPVWFFNISDIIKEFDGFNYKLVFKSTFRGSFFGKERDRPQLNLPQKFRLKNSCNLLFIKK